MDKIIIENRSDLSMQDSLHLVERVIDKGRVSNNGKQYCYFSVFTVDGISYGVSTDLNKKSDRFVVTNQLSF